MNDSSNRGLMAFCASVLMHDEDQYLIKVHGDDFRHANTRVLVRLREPYPRRYQPHLLKKGDVIHGVCTQAAWDDWYWGRTHDIKDAIITPTVVVNKDWKQSARDRCGVSFAEVLQRQQAQPPVNVGKPPGQ